MSLKKRLIQALCPCFEACDMHEGCEDCCLVDSELDGPLARQVADKVLKLLEGPVVEIPEDDSDCTHWQHGDSKDWCGLTGKECNADNCPGSGTYKLVKVD